MKHPDKKLVALACADIHLSGKSPLFRSNEDDWLKVQAGYLKQLKKLTTSLSSLVAEKLPVFIAGDLFDKWSVPPEVMSMSIRELPDKVFCVSGNHDAMNHRREDIHKSAYGVLEAANRIIDVKPGAPVVLEGAHPIRLHGFPYGTEVEPLKKPCDFYLEIALVHAYIWSEGKGYPGALEEKRLGAYRKKLTGYDTVIFGDNHIPLQWNMDKNKDGPSIFNPGSFMIRKRDDKHNPRVGLIFADGSVEVHSLDISQDKYLDSEEIMEVLDVIGANSFVESLLDLGDHALDFASYLNRLMEREKVDQRVKDMIVKALDKGEVKNGK